jgi:hypothetical protein
MAPGADGADDHALAHWCQAHFDDADPGTSRRKYLETARNVRGGVISLDCLMAALEAACTPEPREVRMGRGAIFMGTMKRLMRPGPRLKPRATEPGLFDPPPADPEPGPCEGRHVEDLARELAAARAVVPRPSEPPPPRRPTPPPAAIAAAADAGDQLDGAGSASGFFARFGRNGTELAGARGGEVSRPSPASGRRPRFAPAVEDLERRAGDPILAAELARRRKSE